MIHITHSFDPIPRSDGSHWKKALNCLRLGSRIDAVASRLETAVRMNTVTSSMKGVVKGMDKGLASMDVDKISKIMDKFEQQFEDLDVKAAYMDSAMNATTASATPVDQVDELVKMVADENNLELGEAFGDLGGLYHTIFIDWQVLKIKSMPICQLLRGTGNGMVFYRAGENMGGTALLLAGKGRPA